MKILPRHFLKNRTLMVRHHLFRMVFSLVDTVTGAALCLIILDYSITDGSCKLIRSSLLPGKRAVKGWTKMGWRPLIGLHMQNSQQCRGERRDTIQFGYSRDIVHNTISRPCKFIIWWIRTVGLGKLPLCQICSDPT
jgi:hypothetical protein